MLAAQREKRVTAGNRMTKLLEAEDEDDFYKTTYGGFDEEEEDNDYNSSQSDSDDFIDSDFSIDENDEVKSDAEEDAKPKRKRKGVVTKAYKDPKGDKSEGEKKRPAKKPKKEHKGEATSSVQIFVSHERKSMRRSTALKSEAALSRQKLDNEKEKMLKELAVKKNVASIRRMTQEELLEEAKITEIQNMKSLENYQKLELEKKRVRVVKKAYQGPLIRYLSCTMPLIEELPLEPEVNVESEDSTEAKKPELTAEEKCERTFITFTEESTFKEIFKQKPKPAPGKSLCVVTKKPAKYFDPITQVGKMSDNKLTGDMVPYANALAFKIIREAYAKQLQTEKQSSSRPSSPSTVVASTKRKDKAANSPQPAS